MKLVVYSSFAWSKLGRAQTLSQDGRHHSGTTSRDLTARIITQLGENVKKVEGAYFTNFYTSELLGYSKVRLQL
jgi:hypothetical protein